MRPHHLLCIQGFRGQGYSPQFVANLARLIDRLNTDPGLRVRIVSGADDVCLACPYLSSGFCSRPDQNVDDLDTKVLARLGLTVGDSGSWSSITQLIREKISPENLPEICERCRWLDFDYCTKSLKGTRDAKNPAGEGTEEFPA